MYEIMYIHAEFDKSVTSCPIGAPFYGYLKLLKLHRAERSQSKDVRSEDRTWDLLHKGRALTDCAIISPYWIVVSNSALNID